jgi:hypothetical protein
MHYRISPRGSQKLFGFPDHCPYEFPNQLQLPFISFPK